MSRKKARPAYEPDVTVLLGAPGVSMPADWWVGVVKWSDDEEVLVEQYGIGGTNPHHQLHSVAHVRASGTVAELVDFRASCIAELAPLIDAVRAAENALTEARRAVYRQLDAMAKADGAR